MLHITARAIAKHALSIFGDHQDVMAARQVQKGDGTEMKDLVLTHAQGHT